MIDDLVRDIFLTAPGWIRWLLQLRNKLVKPLGLETEVRGAAIASEGPLEVGKHVGFFKIFERTDSHVLMGQDDKHLDYRVLVAMEPVEPAARSTTPQRELVVATAVCFNNALGTLYFVPVRPFHKRIVPALIRHGLRRYEQGHAENE